MTAICAERYQHRDEIAVEVANGDLLCTACFPVEETISVPLAPPE